MSNKVFKNSQITYGVPFQVRMPVAPQNYRNEEETQGIFVTPDEPEITEKPQEIIQRAHEEAEVIIKEAEYDARRIVEDAYTEAKEKAAVMEEEAWQRGYSEGLAAAQKQCEAMIEEAESMKARSMVEHDEALAGMESEIISLVLEVSKKVIGSEIALNKENMIYLIKQAIDGCSNRNGIIVKVAPEDYSFIDANRSKLAECVECADTLELRQDGFLKPGSCILETPFGSMDAGVKTRLDKIEEAFLELSASEK